MHLSAPETGQTRRRSMVLLLACLAVPVSAARSQEQAAGSASLAPGPRPADAPPEWKRLVGVYGTKASSSIVLERDLNLLWRTPDERESLIHPDQNNVTFTIEGRFAFKPVSDLAGNIAGLLVLAAQNRIPRLDAGSGTSGFYHIRPLRPVEDLSKAALMAEPPDEDADFDKPDLVELAPLDPAFHLDIRYAQSNNFLSTPVYTQARAFLQRPAAEALLAVLHKLQPFGYGLLIHDAYRPWYVTKIFWDATPPEGKVFVADPKKGSKHNRGCAVDITLYHLATGKPAEMPGLYDEMSPRSYPAFPGGTSLERWHRDLLRRAMESEGFTVNQAEWWHFDYKDWKRYPILNVRFEQLGSAGGK